MTMVKHNQLNTLLMEILIVVLFFALCSTVILDVFVGAHNQSARAGAKKPCRSKGRRYAIYEQT